MDNQIKIEIIRDYLFFNKMTKKEFCNKCGIGISVLNKILARKCNFRVSAVFKIARFLNMQIYQLFK